MGSQRWSGTGYGGRFRLFSRAKFEQKRPQKRLMRINRLFIVCFSREASPGNLGSCTGNTCTHAVVFFELANGSV